MRPKRLPVLLALLCLWLAVAMAATPVDLDGCALLLDEDGLPLVQAGDYSEILMGPEGFLTARRASDGRWTALDASGTVQAEEGYDLIRQAGGRLILKKGGLYALAEMDFTPLTPWEYSLILPAGEGFFAFRTNLFDDRADILYILDRDGEARPTSRRYRYSVSFSRHRIAFSSTVMVLYRGLSSHAPLSSIAPMPLLTRAAATPSVNAEQAEKAGATAHSPLSFR